MTTKYLINNEKNIKIAAKIIKKGGIVAFPTETVYGIGVNIFDKNAANLLYNIKKRDINKPLSAHISDISMLNFVADTVPDIFYELANIFLPGALTMIVKAKSTIPLNILANTRTIAIRFPNNEICKNFINEVGFPLAATSANISGNTSAITPIEVQNELSGKINAVIDGGECVLKQESTVISLVENPKIIRVGAIKIEEIEEKIGRKIF